MPITIVLPDTASRDAIDDAIDLVGLKLTNLVRESAAHPRQIVASSPAAFATFVEDARLGVRYAVVDGQRAEVVAVGLRAALGSIDWDEVDARAKSESAIDRAWALRHAVTFHLPERAEEIVVRLLADPDAVVRRVALVAAPYALTDAVRAALVVRAKTEPDSTLRAAADALVLALGQPS